MGGYGGASGRVKEKCYYDTGGHKVKDQNAVAVGEYYIKQGKYVAFLKEIPNENRADMSVEGVHIEVKGMSSPNPSQVAKNLKKGFTQVDADNKRHPTETHRPGTVVILSEYKTLEEAQRVVKAGYDEAVRKGYVTGNVKLFHNGVMYDIT